MKYGKKREDLYLLTPGNTGIGPKLREGKLEIKLLQGCQETTEPVISASAKSEIWHKWKGPYAKGKKDKKIDKLITKSILAGTQEKLRVTVWKKGGRGNSGSPARENWSRWPGDKKVRPGESAPNLPAYRSREHPGGPWPSKSVKTRMCHRFSYSKV